MTHRGDPAFALVTSALGRGEVTAGLATALLVMIAEDRARWEPLQLDGRGCSLLAVLRGCACVAGKAAPAMTVAYVCRVRTRPFSKCLIVIISSSAHAMKQVSSLPRFYK